MLAGLFSFLGLFLLGGGEVACFRPLVLLWPNFGFRLPIGKKLQEYFRAYLGADTMEDSDLPEVDRDWALQSIRRDQRHLKRIHEKLVRSHQVIKRAENAISGSTALLKQIDGEGQ